MSPTGAYYNVMHDWLFAVGLVFRVFAGAWLAKRIASRKLSVLAAKTLLHGMICWSS